jgi:hypothetical protein
MRAVEHLHGVGWISFCHFGAVLIFLVCLFFCWSVDMTLAILGMLSRVFSDAPVAIFYTQKREDCSCICAQMSRYSFAIASGVS